MPIDKIVPDVINVPGPALPRSRNVGGSIVIQFTADQIVLLSACSVNSSNFK